MIISSFSISSIAHSIDLLIPNLDCVKKGEGVILARHTDTPAPR